MIAVWLLPLRPLLAGLALALAAPVVAASAAQLDPPGCEDGRPLGPPVDEGKDPGPCAVPGEAPRAAGAALAEAAADTDVQHYRLDIELIPEFSGPDVTAVRAIATTTIDFEPTVDGLTGFGVDLRANLVVTAVKGDVASFARVGDTVEITLDRAYDTGESVQVAVTYDGYPETDGFGAFRWWIRSGSLVVATLSQPFFAHYWWACKDALDDKATMETHVTVPDTMLALSNGVDGGSEVVSGGRVVYHWSEINPMIPYLASLAVTGYERYDLQYDYDDGGSPATMPVVCYVYPDHWDGGAGEPLPGQKAGCDELPEMLETLAGLFGEYPFVDEKYGVVETGGTGGLGANMEHQTLSSMYQLNGYTNIMAHELGHQWWGDDVTCETWYDIWLNEGMATYSEALFREFRPGASEAAYWNRMNTRRPGNPNARVYRDDVSSVGAIFDTNAVYNKGAWVLHMLRHLLGDTAFFDFLAFYRGVFSEDSATTAEFGAALSASFGEDLSWFVDQWVLATGSPDYEWRYEFESVGGAHTLKLAIEQLQDGQGFGLFTMPLDLRVTTTLGTTVHTVWNDGWEEYYALPLDAPGLSVELDSDGGVANRNWVLWDTRTLVALPVSAPPALLEVTSQTQAAAGVTTLQLRFSEDVGSFDVGDLSLVGTAGAIAPDAVSYDAATRTASLDFQGLAFGAYTLTLLAAGIEANGRALDGEADTLAWWDDVELPSGDGQPGGDAVLALTVGAPVPASGGLARAVLALALLGLGRSALARLPS